MNSMVLRGGENCISKKLTDKPTNLINQAKQGKQLWLTSSVPKATPLPPQVKVKLLRQEHELMTSNARYLHVMKSKFQIMFSVEFVKEN